MTRSVRLWQLCTKSWKYKTKQNNIHIGANRNTIEYFFLMWCGMMTVMIRKQLFFCQIRMSLSWTLVIYQCTVRFLGYEVSVEFSLAQYLFLNTQINLPWIFYYSSVIRSHIKRRICFSQSLIGFWNTRNKTVMSNFCATFYLFKDIRTSQVIVRS